MSEVVQPNSEGSKQPVDQKPMSDADFLSRRVAKLQEKAAPKAQPKPEPESEPEKVKAEATQPSTEGSEEQAKPSKAVLSKDVDELTDEDIAELAEKGKSGLLKRVAELTAKRKLAEERAAQLEAAMRQHSTQIPEPKVENNPFADVKDFSALSEKAQTYSEVVEWAEEVLDQAEGSSPNDIVATLDGKEHTKASIKQILRNARKAKDKFIPARLKELQQEAMLSQVEQSFRQQARKELGWMEQEDNDTRKRYEAMTSDPRFKKLRSAVPELAPQLDYLVAHAANSLYARRTIEIEQTPRKPTTLTPPSAPATSAAAPERASSRGESAIGEIESRFKKTGRPDDFVALRAAQLSKRKSLKLA